MLTPEELAALRGDMRQTLTDTCVISRPVESVGAAGLVTRTFGVVGTAICRLDPANRLGTRDVIAARGHLPVYRQLTLPHDADLRRGDRVTVGLRTYEVMQLDDDHSLRAVRRAMIAGV